MIKARRQAGISLIEVLAAMVIFSTSAVVLFDWVSQTASRLARLNVEQQQLFGELSAMEFLRGLNPMSNPSGSIGLKGVKLSWQSQPEGVEAPVRRAAGGTGNYVVQLYKVEVLMAHERAAPTRQTLYLAGWRQTTEVRRDMPFK
ncbi:type II secretion system protein [Pelomonas sp. V22]|uniref:PulJ/GspJ family protein n=1 Tax=Pelomonas sp. V22 TaxID=2822139 RepID=UPI0024A97517|nr:type II secretion system protein [Pelomonas sp. V22]MDI4632511.1 type II secretion system protein [Pelomonas sp. V22]